MFLDPKSSINEFYNYLSTSCCSSNFVNGCGLWMIKQCLFVGVGTMFCSSHFNQSSRVLWHSGSIVIPSRHCVMNYNFSNFKEAIIKLGRGAGARLYGELYIKICDKYHGVILRCMCVYLHILSISTKLVQNTRSTLFLLPLSSPSRYTPFSPRCSNSQK